MAIATFPSDSVDVHVETQADWVMSTEEAGRFHAMARGQANVLLLLDGGRAIVCVDHAQDWDFVRASGLARQKGYGVFFWENTDGRRGEGRLRGDNRYESVARRLLSVA